jgi:hypothetical protein
MRFDPFRELGRLQLGAQQEVPDTGSATADQGPNETG